MTLSRYCFCFIEYNTRGVYQRTPLAAGIDNIGDCHYVIHRRMFMIQFSIELIQSGANILILLFIYFSSQYELAYPKFHITGSTLTWGFL